MGLGRGLVGVRDRSAGRRRSPRGSRNRHGFFTRFLVFREEVATVKAMGIRRDVVCAICGFAACACAHVAGAHEAAHPHQADARLAITVDALPVEPDHTHRDYDRAVRIVGSSVTVSGTSSDAPPWFQNTVARDTANLIAQHYRERDWHPTYYATGPQLVLPPQLLASGSSS